MKEMNFRKLEKLNVPDELMEKLLAIPETAEEKAPAVIPWYRSRRVIAAASLVLVSVLSLLLYFFVGNKMNLPVSVKPSPSATEIVWSTDESGETVATEIVVVPDSTTQPTEAKSGVARLIERLFGTQDNTAPTNAPGSDRGRTSPTVKTSPTDGSRSDPTSPTQRALAPTQGNAPITPSTPAAEKPDDLPEPTRPPTVAPTAKPCIPTEPPYVAPTEPPDEEPIEPPSEPPWERPTTAPSEPPWQHPPDGYEYTDTVTDVVYVGDLEEDAVIYCWLYNNRPNEPGLRLWDDDVNASMAVAAEVELLGDGYARLSYTPKEHGFDLPYQGRYRYRWAMYVSGSYYPRSIGSGTVYLYD